MGHANMKVCSKTELSKEEFLAFSSDKLVLKKKELSLI